MIIIGIGFCFWVTTVLKILLSAFFFAAIGSVLWLSLQKKGKNKTIPFVPYLLLSSGFILIR